jgi:fimbrial chaperone protein
MLSRPGRLGPALALAFACCSGGDGLAASLEIAPTTIELSGARNGVFYVSNRGDRPVAVQVEPFDWTQTGGEDRLSPSAALMISPPITELAPGATQTVRLQSNESPAASEHAFRLLVSELPAPVTEEAPQVRVLLQLSVPVFEGAGAAGAARLAWTAALVESRLVVTAANLGARRDKLTEVAVVGREAVAPATPSPGPAYILAGAKRSWSAPATGLRAGDVVTVQYRSGDDGRIVTVPVEIRS